MWTMILFTQNEMQKDIHAVPFQAKYACERYKRRYEEFEELVDLNEILHTLTYRKIGLLKLMFFPSLFCKLEVAVNL